MPILPRFVGGGGGKGSGGSGGSSGGGGGDASGSPMGTGGSGGGVGMPSPSIDQYGHHVSPYTREDYLKYISYDDFCTYWGYYKRQTVFQRPGIQGHWYVHEAHDKNGTFIVVLKQLQRTATPYYHPEMLNQHYRQKSDTFADWTDYRKRMMDNIAGDMAMPADMLWSFDDAVNKRPNPVPVVPKAPVVTKAPVEYKDEKGNIKYK